LPFFLLQNFLGEDFKPHACDIAVSYLSMMKNNGRRTETVKLVLIANFGKRALRTAVAIEVGASLVAKDIRRMKLH
jgi:hypothetical protein